MKRDRARDKSDSQDETRQGEPPEPPYVAATRYAELGVTTNFSFLRGGSHPEEYVAQAAMLDLAGVGIADRNTLAGVVRAYSAYIEWKRAAEEAAKAAAVSSENMSPLRQLRLLIGCRLVFVDGAPDILAYPVDRAAYGRLTRLLTTGNLRAPKGECHLTFGDLVKHAEGLQLVIMERSTNELELSVIKEPKDGPVWPISPFPKNVFPDEAKNGNREAPADEPSALLHDNVINFDAEKNRRSKSRSDEPPESLVGAIDDLRDAGAKVWLGVSALYGPAPRARWTKRLALAWRLGVPPLATNDALYHHPDRRALHDVLTCVRHRTTLDKVGRLLQANAERHLKHGDEMRRLFAAAPEAIDKTMQFIEGISFCLSDIKSDYPFESREGFNDAQSALEHFAKAGAIKRYPDGVPEKVAKVLDEELEIIRKLGYAPYFLTVHHIIEFARGEGILCQGRGSAANSTVCFCLGVTEVNPVNHELLFARFVSEERNEPPDIDIDFEHSQREIVMQYVYRHYRKERVGLAASVITYRTRSALRDVGKAFGLSEDMVTALSGAVGGWWDKGIPDAELRRIGLDPSDARLSQTLKLADELHGFPRHLSQHTGGFIISRTRLDEIAPLQNAAMDDRIIVEWDKDDLEVLKLMKVDCLALGMLTCLKGCFDLLEKHYPHRRNEDNGRKIDAIAAIPYEKKPVYDMIQRADTLGVFQIESRAQMSMLPRLKPKDFYDLVIEVAIVRPGPIQGDMVHPYLRRREGKEKPEYPSPKYGNPNELYAVLNRTMGVPLFQEQAMQIAIVAAEFTPSEADRLRRAMATFKRVGTIDKLKRKMIDGMVRRGYEQDFAERCFKQIEGFGDYGFPESHAASFAILVYASCWFKCVFPDVFACALLNAQPMGFYAPAQIVRDARDHGVAVREVDINRSEWNYTLEKDGDESLFSHDRIHSLHASMADVIESTHALRMGFRQISGLSEKEMEKLVAARGAGYDSIRDLWLRAELSRETLERLADADAFRSIGLDRRQALWAVKALRRSGDKDDLPLFAETAMQEREPDADLPPMPLGAHVVEDYRRLSLSLKGHPASFVRNHLAARGVAPCETVRSAPANRRITVGGLVLVRQRPGSASGVIFMTLEDETGIANAVIWPQVFERYRPVVLGSRLVAVRGRLQSESNVIHVIAEHLEDMSFLMDEVSEPKAPFDPHVSRADEARHPTGDDPRTVLSPAQERRLAQMLRDRPELAAEIAALNDRNSPRRVLPKGRNFH
ncbi:error-prone DNA polymerase [Terrarubrum flagellatum]|uniref:error-prone DNA polymerase n=1 Tax=Terrirubrum flagellatum TaxID=2895980 RepID=UPI0031453BB5